MNDLNSVIIAGVCDNLKICKETVDFKLYSTRSRNGEPHTIAVRVSASGKVAMACKTLSFGQGVRVVGRIDKDISGVFVKAEHIEFKPISEGSDGEL